MQRTRETPLPPVLDESKGRRAAIASVAAIRLATLVDSLILSGLLLALAVLPLQSFSSEFSMGMGLLLLFLWCGQAALRKRAVIVWTPLHITLLVFLGIALLQLVPLPFQPHPVHLNESFKGLPVQLDQWNTITFDKRLTTTAAAVLAALMGYFFIAASILDSEKRLRRVVDWVIVLGFAISLLGVLDLFSDPGDPLFKEKSHFFGLYYYSLNRLTGYIEMVFPLPLAMVLAGGVRRDQALLYGFASITIGVAVALGNTTGGLFVLVVEFMILFLLVVKQRSKVKEWGSEKFDRIWLSIAAVVIIGTIVAGTVWLATQSIPQTVASDVTSEGSALSELQNLKSDYSYSRAGMWKASLEMIADHPLLGVGFGAYSIAYPPYDSGSGTVLVNTAHNDYLQAVCETGLIGGIVIVLFLYFLVRLSRRSLKSERPVNRAVALGATVGCFGILVHSLVDFHLQSPGTALLFLMLIALLVSVERMR